MMSDSQIKLGALPLGPLGTNCYLMWRSDLNEAIVFDPGGDHENLLAFTQDQGVSIAAIAITHGHFDHIGGVAGLAAATGAPVWMNKAEAATLENPELFARAGYPEVPPYKIDNYITDDLQKLELAGISLEILRVPGHSPGHLAYFYRPSDNNDAAEGDSPESSPICIIGDVIFKGSIGRTDLPSADPVVMDQTLSMLRDHLPEKTLLLSGHGEPTTMQQELLTNPFLQKLAKR